MAMNSEQRPSHGSRIHRSPRPSARPRWRSQEEVCTLADVMMPWLGETVTEGAVTRWMKAVGEPVERDKPLFEVSTDKTPRRDRRRRRVCCLGILKKDSDSEAPLPDTNPAGLVVRRQRKPLKRASGSWMVHEPVAW
jgi:hypothetical protein